MPFPFRKFISIFLLSFQTVCWSLLCMQWLPNTCFIRVRLTIASPTIRLLATVSEVFPRSSATMMLSLLTERIFSIDAVHHRMGVGLLLKERLSTIIPTSYPIMPICCYGLTVTLTWQQLPRSVVLRCVIFPDVNRSSFVLTLSYCHI